MRWLKRSCIPVFWLWKAISGMTYKVLAHATIARYTN
jgi:hypothetical protein